MENYQEFIPKIFDSTLITTISSYTVFLVIVFFAIRLLFKRFRGEKHLSIFTFNPNPINKETLYCAVCLHDLIGGERYRKLPQCNHCFHVDCIDEWFKLQSHPTCPICRSQVHHHHLPQHQQHTSILSCFLSFSHSTLTKMSNLLNDDHEIATPLSENFSVVIGKESQVGELPI
ncbi:hypothetical protein CsSME_00012219 [Camellia sinensis var. sinensis]